MPQRMSLVAWILLAIAASGSMLRAEDAPATSGYGAKPSYADRAGYPDSFAYYGPQGLWQKLKSSAALREGRDTWFFWTGGDGPGGTQYFYRALSVNSSHISLRGKIQFYTLAQMTHRDRWEKLGLMNEPNCEEHPQNEPADEFGLRLDRRKKDPVEGAYPTDPNYGLSTGIIGLRMFPNPKFDAHRWSYPEYEKDPGKMEPPHLFGITCAFCHVAFDPLNPPADPVRPRWENLSANIGNQYLHEGRLFFGSEGLFRFDESKGLGPTDFIWHYGETQQRGTSETSRFSYDFLNNPNTINAVFYVGRRTQFFETTPPGRPQRTLHVLKDGADSVGLEMGLARVFVNIGMEGPYWIDHLWNPVTGTQQSPMLLDEIRRKASPERLKYLDERYAEKPGDPTVGYTPAWPMGKSWALTEKRIPALISYLSAYTPMRLRDAKDGKKHLLDEAQPDQAERLRKGKILFADNCAECHSNRQPFYLLVDEAERREFYRNSVLADDFLEGNTLTSDERIPVTRMQVNAARSLATNAIEGDIWADFSSRDYKALPAVGVLKFPSLLGGEPITFTAPGGGRGYYRPSSLVSLWATAPYLHNNSVGPLTSVSSKVIPDPSVEERVLLFEKGMRQMLLLEPRPTAVKLTSEDCTFLPPDVLRRVLASFVAGKIGRKLAPGFQRAVKEGVLSPQAAGALAAELEKELEQKVADILSGSRLFANAAVEGLAKQQEVVTADLEEHLAHRLGANPDLKPLVPKLRPLFRPELDAAVKSAISDLRAVVNLDVKVPKGLPINLLLNLRTDKLLYVGLLLSQSRNDQQALVEGLLRLSDCPDLIENHGHPFGTRLTEGEKLDLIEFLKTF